MLKAIVCLAALLASSVWLVPGLAIEAEGTATAASSQGKSYTVSPQVFEKIDKRYGDTAALLKTLPGQIEQNQQTLAEIRRKMQHQQNETDKESKELARQVRAAYRIGQQEQLKLLLSQKDPGLSSRMLTYYDYFNKERLAKLKTIETSLAQLGEMDKQKQAEAAQLQENLAQKKAEQVKLDALRAERKALLDQIPDDFASHEQRLNQLRENGSQLRELVASLHIDAATDQELATPDTDESKADFAAANANFSTLKGVLHWPTKGQVSQIANDTSVDGFSDSVVISAKEGLEVHAVANGKVIFADWMQSYGLLLIVKHDDGYMTLYAYNQSLYKHKNEAVAAGEVIASVGQSGGQQEPGLYFAIRKDGTPLDPHEWCRKK